MEDGLWPKRGRVLAAKISGPGPSPLFAAPRASKEKERPSLAAQTTQLLLPLPNNTSATYVQQTTNIAHLLPVTRSPDYIRPPVFVKDDVHLPAQSATVFRPPPTA